MSRFWDQAEEPLCIADFEGMVLSDVRLRIRGSEIA
jgi:hypothetical protein